MTQHSGAGSTSKTGKRPKRGSGYPKRTPFFFHRFVRWLIKTCAAMVIGADGCFLCTVVGATEDSSRYRRAVRFYNPQLADMCGWSVDKLDRVRRRCIDEGFLHYEPGGNRTPGLYWVLVDETLGDAPDLGPIGESESDFDPQSAEHPAEDSAFERDTRSSTEEFDPDFIPHPAEDVAEDSATEPRRSCGEIRDKPAELTYLPLSNSSPPPPPDETDSKPGRTEPPNDTTEWVVVKEELISSGVGDWRRLLDSYRQTGCSVAHALELIAFWKEHRDRFDSPAGVLHRRMNNAHPSIPADDRKHWPGLQAKHQPKPAPEIEVGRYAAEWSRLRPSRRAELARHAQIDLSRHEGRSLSELPEVLQTPIVRLLASGWAKRSQVEPDT